MGMFDDLIPTKTGGGLFDDLIPAKPTPQQIEAMGSKGLPTEAELKAAEKPAFITKAPRPSKAKIEEATKKGLEEKIPFEELYKNPELFTVVKDLASSDKAAKGYAAGREVLIKEMTKDGKPKSEMHKNALLSAGVQFDQDGNAVNPKVNYGGTEGAPAAPASSAPRRGGPSARPTAAIDVAAARAEANNAIAKGADANAVKARFKQQTGQDL